VFLAVGHVGGIFANDTFPADFVTDNLALGLDVIRGSYKAGVKKLLVLGLSCIYPKFAAQPMSEDALLTGPLEPTNEWYAVAKIAAIKLCEAYRKQHGADFISAMPTNLYGRGDNYHPQNSPVPAALLRRFHEGKLANAPAVMVWDTGKLRREFLCPDDLAAASVFLMKRYSDLGFLNVGTGEDVTIADFADEVVSVVGDKGSIEFDTARPDGPPQRLLESRK
jgi:GDP-L-fucose synthase